ncbi:MAG: hypothetical protein IIW95_04220 [Lachnospiraceae bacterium]|nr:hypothetical protein [Lachnospiraceae bacterium]
MPDKTANVRNHLQRYILLIGDAATKEESLQTYDNLLQSLNQLAETTEEYYWKNEDGKMPALKKEDIAKIHDAYKNVIKNCSRMLTIPDEQLKGVHVLVSELSMLLSRDEAALDVVSPDKNMTLTEILENGRAVTVDIGDQPVSSVGNQLSSRIPLQVEGNDNVVRNVYFTKSSFADPVVNRDRILADFRLRYPEMTEIFDHIETCDGETFNRTIMGRAEVNVKNIPDPERARNAAYQTWSRSLEELKVPGEVTEKYQANPRYPKMMIELTAAIEQYQNLYILYVEHKTSIHTDKDANIDKRNAAMSAVSSLIGKPALLAKAEPMILMQNGKAVSGTFMEQAPGKDAYHLSNDDPMRAYNGDVYDNPEVFADIAAMQALDYICGNIDRHEGNMFYQFGTVNGKTKLIGITGIDNDLSFGMTPPTTNNRIGNMWVQPEQFGVLDAATAEKILAIEKSVLQTTLRGYGLSEKEIDAAWERTAHLQEKILEGLEHYKDKQPGEVEAGFLRIVSSDEWHHYNRETLANAGNNQFKMLGELNNLIKKHEASVQSKERSMQTMNAKINDLFQIENEVVNEKPPVPVGRVLGHGTMLKEPERKHEEPLKFVVPNDTALEFTSGAMNKRFAFSYEDQNGNLKECFFTKANTLEVYEAMDRAFDGFIERYPNKEEFLERMRAYFHRIDMRGIGENVSYIPDFEELGYDEVEAEALKADFEIEKLVQMIDSRMFGVFVTNPETILYENRSASERVDMRNVAMSQMGDSLGVPNLLARTTPVQIQMGESIVDGVAMERADGIDVNNLRKGDIPAEITDDIFDGIGLKSVADLQILDYICMNLDRHTGNMIYKFEGLDTGNPRFAGVQGIDNDCSVIGICPKPDQGVGIKGVALDQITVISETMAEKVLHMQAEDISNTLSDTTLNKKEIIAAQQRLARLQDAIENKKVRIVSDEEWKDMKLNDLATYKNLFGRVKEARERMKNPREKARKTVSFEKIDRVERFEKAALDNQAIDKYMSAAKEGFENDMLEIAKAAKPFNEMDEKDVFLAAKENLKLLSRMIDKADPSMMRSSKEFRHMKKQCEWASKTVQRMERDMKRNHTTEPSAEQSQSLFESIAVLKRTASSYEMYKIDALDGHDGNKIEQARLTAARIVEAVSEKLCVGFRANAKARNLELHTGRTLNREIKTVINEMKSPDFDKADRGRSFAKIIYLKTIVENSAKLKKSNSLTSALNEKSIEKGIAQITKNKAFERFMNRPQENLLTMLESKNGLPFYQEFRRDYAAALAETGRENIKDSAEAVKQPNAPVFRGP